MNARSGGAVAPAAEPLAGEGQANGEVAGCPSNDQRQHCMSFMHPRSRFHVCFAHACSSSSNETLNYFVIRSELASQFLILRMVLASPRARFHANIVCIPVRCQLLPLKLLARLGPARLERPLADIVVIRNCAISCKIDKI